MSPGLSGRAGSGKGLLCSTILGPRHRLGDARLPCTAGCTHNGLNRTSLSKYKKKLMSALRANQTPDQVSDAESQNSGIINLNCCLILKHMQGSDLILVGMLLLITVL